MTARTIQTPPRGQRPRARPLALAAVALFTLEALLALVGATWGPLAVAALVLAPGLALLPLLPAPARESPSAALAAAPALGIAATSIAVITVSSLGIELSGVSVRVAAALPVAAGLALRLPEPVVRFERGEATSALGGAAAVALGLVLQSRLIGETPVPGNDWAKYVLYADEIVRHGALLIENPFWMLGVPFREDPGVPALYGAYLLMTGDSAVVVQQGIGLFALAQVAAVYAFGRAVWGGAAGVVAALLWAALPLGYTLLGWHGLANASGLVLLTLLLAYLTAFACSRLDAAAAIGAGMTVAGLAAAHRLSLGIGLLTAALTVAVALMASSDRRGLLRGLAIAVGAAVVFGPGVAYDLLERSRGSGGLQDHTAYLGSKVDLELLVNDLTVPLALVGAAALFVAPFVVRDRRTLLPVLCLVAVVAGLAYAWVVELPLHYTRMAYYLPLALLPLIGVSVGRLPRPPVAVGAALALVAATAVVAWDRADNVRGLYNFANAASARGLDRLSAALRPGEVVVTDRCWSFLGTWLLKTPILPALDTLDIQPKAELPFAGQARAVLAGGEAGARVVRRHRIRFAIVDPTCLEPDGRPADAPRIGRPVFVSRRLVVIRIGGGW